MRAPPKTAVTSSFLVVLVGAVVGWSCTPHRPDLGAVTLSLSLDDGTILDTVSFLIVSASGATLASGTIDTQNSNGSVAIATSVAVSSGDIATLFGISRDGIPCRGMSEPFDVRISEWATIHVTLACQRGTPPPSVGTVTINSAVVKGNNCPVLTSWVVAPLQTSANIAVAATAADADTSDALRFTWAATNGTFADPTAPATMFYCTQTGPQTLTVVVSDNHTPTACADGVSIPVQCVVPGAADAGAPGG